MFRRMVCASCAAPSLFLAQWEFFFFVLKFLPRVSHCLSRTAGKQCIHTREDFFDFFLTYNGFASLFVFFVFGFFTIASAAYFMFARRGEKHQRFMFVLIAAIAQFFVATILVSVSPLIPFPVRYFTPILGIMIIFVAEMVVGSFPKTLPFLFIKIALASLLVLVLSPRIADHLTAAMRNLVISPKKFFPLSYISPPFISAVEKEIHAIQEIDQRRDFTFFGVQTLHFDRGTPFSDEIFWASLEHDLRVPLIAVLDDPQRDYAPIGDPVYLFLSCEQSADVGKECFVPFSVKFPQYRIYKKIYDYPLIYLARREAP